VPELQGGTPQDRVACPGAGYGLSAGPHVASGGIDDVEIAAYLLATYVAARHLARKADSDDWVAFLPTALAWPFFPLAWVIDKLGRR